MSLNQQSDPSSKASDTSNVGQPEPPAERLSKLTLGSSDTSQAEAHPAAAAGSSPHAADNVIPRLPSLQISRFLQHSSSTGALGLGGPFASTPYGASGPNSPTAASEYSVTTTHGSTSSAVPFSHIAHQRKQQEREVALQDAASTLLTDAAAAFDLRMQSYTHDITTLQELNEAAAQQYSGSAEIAAALGQFVSDLVARQAAAKEALSVLPQLDRQLELLATAVTQLEKRSKQLEARVGLKSLSASGGSSSSGAYSYLASSVSTLTAVGVSTAAAGLGCLGGSTAGPSS
jgi:hypothetical protein